MSRFDRPLQGNRFNVLSARAVPPLKVHPLGIQTNEGPPFVPASRIRVHTVRAVVEGRYVTVAQNHPVERVASKKRAGLIVENVGGENLFPVLVELPTDPLGEPKPHIPRKKRPVKPHRYGVTQKGAQPGSRLIGRRQAIAVREMEAVAEVGSLNRIRDECDPQLLREVVPMPRIVIPKQVRDRNPSVGPPSEQSLKTNKALGNQPSIFDVPVEHISEQIKMVDLVCLRFETLNEGSLLFSLRLASPSSKVHVGDKENHRWERKEDRGTRSQRGAPSRTDQNETRRTCLSRRRFPPTA